MASALAARDRRTAVVYVRVSAGEKRALERWAKAAGLPLAVLLRATAAEAAALAGEGLASLRSAGTDLKELEPARLASFPGEVVDQAGDLVRQIEALLYAELAAPPPAAREKSTDQEEKSTEEG